MVRYFVVLLFFSLSLLGCNSSTKSNTKQEAITNDFSYEFASPESLDKPLAEAYTKTKEFETYQKDSNTLFVFAKTPLGLGSAMKDHNGKIRIWVSETAENHVMIINSPGINPDEIIFESSTQ